VYLFINLSQVEFQPILGLHHVMPDCVLIWKRSNIFNGVLILLS
jgi:hypothetical protein